MEELQNEVYIPLNCTKCNKHIWIDAYLNNGGLCVDCGWGMRGYVKPKRECDYATPKINIMEILENVRKENL